MVKYEKKSANNTILTAALFFAVSVLSVFLFIYLPCNVFPADDALILFRYSENLARTGVITYNTGGIPVEGATDFLWMVLLAGFAFCGLDTWAGALVLSYLSVLGTGFIVYRLLGERNRGVLFLILLFLLVFKTTFSSVVGFSTVFFGFAIALTLYFNQKDRPKSLFAAALLTCLIRPDGVVCVAPVIAHSIIRNRRTLWRTLAQCMMFFVVPGVIYFLWRWDYFGMFFPLPFYIKSANVFFNYNSFLINLRFNSPFFVALVFLALCFFYRRRTIHVPWCVFYGILFLAPFLFYSKTILIQNVNYRFQHPFVIIHLCIMALVCRSRDMKKVFVLSLAGLILFSLPQAYSNCLNIWFGRYNSLYHVARAAADKSINASFVTTEAGLVPYYTNWHTVDAYGLNTPEFTQRVITPRDMQEIRPDVVSMYSAWTLYDFLDGLHDIPEAAYKSWPGMVTNIAKGLSTRHYDIWMVPAFDVASVRRDALFNLQKRNPDFGPYYDKLYYCFFIRKGFAQRRELIEILSACNAVPYATFKNTIRPDLKNQLREPTGLQTLLPAD